MVPLVYAIKVIQCFVTLSYSWHLRNMNGSKRSLLLPFQA